PAQLLAESWQTCLQVPRGATHQGRNRRAYQYRSSRMGEDCMSTIRPARWVAGHAASGLRDLPRNGAWLLSKALRSPVAATESAAHDTSDGLRRMTIAVADKLPGAPDAVGIKLKRAETAVARAKEAERQAV